MRNITRAPVEAFYNGTEYKNNNTVVKNKMMLLHWNLIAEIKGWQLYIDNCGWKTSTTKERINWVLEYLNKGLKVFQKSWSWYIEGNELEDVLDFEIYNWMSKWIII